VSEPIRIGELLVDVLAALTCPDCTGINSAACDVCDHTGRQRCEQRTGPAEHCETARPCTRHDRHLLEQAIA
jgi:hypothetical protein